MCSRQTWTSNEQQRINNQEHIKAHFPTIRDPMDNIYALKQSFRLTNLEFTGLRSVQYGQYQSQKSEMMQSREIDTESYGYAQPYLLTQTGA